jgi:hypothetical protein
LQRRAADYAALAIEDAQRWADAEIALVEHRITEEDFVSAVRPFVVEG